MENGIRVVSGLFFRLADYSYGVKEKQNRIAFILYIEKKSDSKDRTKLQRWVHLSGYAFRIILFEIAGKEYIGYELLGNADEKEEMESLLGWIIKTHENWNMLNCQKETFTILGIRMANNRFHAKKLMLQGEHLDYF